MGKIIELTPKTGVRLCNAAIVFFLVAFLFAGFCSFVGPLVPHLFTGLRFPLAGLTGIAVDQDENIYTISQGYGRLQVFDKTGKFVRGWFGPFSHATFWLNITKDGNLSIIFADKEYTYGVDGELLKKSDFSEDFPYENIRQGKNETYDSEGDLYAPIDSFCSKVIKFSPSGEMSTVVSDPIWFCIIKVPFNLIILVALVFLRDYFKKCYTNTKKRDISHKVVPIKNSIRE